MSAPLHSNLSSADEARGYRLGLLAALVTALCWAFLALFLKYALTYTNSETLSWFRLFFSALCLQLYFLFKGGRPLSKFRHKKAPLMWTGGLLALNYLGYIKGIAYTSPSHAQIMIQGASVSLFLIGAFYFKERVRPVQWLGLCLTILGFSLFYKDQAPASGGELFVLGNVWLVVASLAWGVFASLQKELLKGATTTEVNLGVFWISSLVLAPLVDFSALSSLTPGEWFWLCVCGLNTLIAYNALAFALSKLPGSVVGPIITLNPLLTIALMFLLQEISFTAFEPDTVQLLGLLGAFFVVLGVILVVKKGKNKRA